MRMLFWRLLWLARRRTKEAELDQELHFHLEEEAEQRRAEGLSQEQAGWAARRELGNVTRVREETRAAWGWTLLEQFGQDLRYGLRTIAGNRLFALLAIVSLALGIGANTVIYSFMDSILLRSLPVYDPESLVLLNWHAKLPDGGDFVMHAMSGTTWEDPTSGVTAGIFPYPAFELFRKHDAVFSTVFAHFPSWQVRRLNVAVQGHAGIAAGECVSGDFFRGLGVGPAAGRLILPDDDRAERRRWPFSATRLPRAASEAQPTRPVSRF